MTAPGSNVHIFARRHRRDQLRCCFETVLGCPVSAVDHPGMPELMLVVSFPGGGHLSIEFTGDAPDDDQLRLGAWLELRAASAVEVLHPVGKQIRARPARVLFKTARPAHGDTRTPARRQRR